MLNKMATFAAAAAVSVGSFAMAQNQGTQGQGQGAQGQGQSQGTQGQGATGQNQGAQRQNQGTGAQSGQDSARQAGSQMRSQPMTQDQEKKLIEEMSAGNNFEVQLSQFVQQRAQDQQVKQLAQMLIQEHQQAEQQLRQVAQSMGVNLTNQLKPHQQAELQEFQQKQPDEMERAYLFCNVADHHKEILQYSWAERNAQNAQLKQYIEQTVPHLRQHLRHTEQAVAAVTGLDEARTASERMQGTNEAGKGTGAGSTNDVTGDRIRSDNTGNTGAGRRPDNTGNSGGGTTGR